MKHVILEGQLQRGTDGAAGYDLFAQRETTIPPGFRSVISTGVKVEMPDDMAALVVPRSGKAAKLGLSVLNAPGLIDSDFRGTIGVILINHGGDPVEINVGDAIAQLLFVPVIHPVFSEGTLGTTTRGEGGFGSTGN